MDKLEKAISLSLKNKELDNSIFNNYEDSEALESIESISKMQSSRKLSEEELLELKLVYPDCKQKKLVDQLRDIRTEVTKHDGKNLIMITSVDEDAGVSFLSSNLAAVTAFDSTKSVLLVDCKMENGTLRSKFKLDDKSGLSDYIFNKDVNDKEIIHEVGIDRFRVVHSGKINCTSGEFFTHPKFKKLLNSLKNRYQDRTVYIDAPPLLHSADARILMEQCDLVLLVVPRGKTSNKKLEAIANIIPKEKMLGAIINNNIN